MINNSRTRVLKVLFVLLFFSNALLSQPFKEGCNVSIGWFSFAAPRQEFMPNVATLSNVNISSSRIVSYAGKLDYNQAINDRLEWSLGAVAGSYPIDFVISFDSVFSVTGYALDTYSYDRYSSVYLGLNLGARFFQPLSARHSLSASLKLNYVFFITQWYRYSLAVKNDAGVFNVFEASAFMNPDEKAFFSPEAAIGYHFKINNRFSPYLSFNGVFSKNYPVVGNNFTLYGENEKIEGTFRRRFLQVGVEVGVKVKL